MHDQLKRFYPLAFASLLNPVYASEKSPPRELYHDGDSSPHVERAHQLTPEKQLNTLKTSIEARIKNITELRAKIQFMRTIKPDPTNYDGGSIGIPPDDQRQLYKYQAPTQLKLRRSSGHMPLCNTLSADQLETSDLEIDKQRTELETDLLKCVNLLGNLTTPSCKDLYEFLTPLETFFSTEPLAKNKYHDLINLLKKKV